VLFACCGSIPECGTLRLATYPSACSNDGSTPPLPPPSPLLRRPCSRFLIPRSMITGAQTQNFLPVFFSEAHSVDRQTKLSTSPYHFTCHDDASAWFCISRVSIRIHASRLDPVLWLATRSAGRAWRSVSRRFFLRFVSPRPMLLFHSFRTISLRFGESRLLQWLAHLSLSPICPSTPSCFFSRGMVMIY
jgi:hypothetical protein